MVGIKTNLYEAKLKHIALSPSRNARRAEVFNDQEEESYRPGNIFSLRTVDVVPSNPDSDRGSRDPATPI